ncbi:YbaB/EbfC family nucleoid-associated protein [Saccharothrix syringae]|uniref:YbaB/EbfC family DNA-binding protein n=1 Tax=Saccharothrix syringae TaxID=103733 RepID=A0A5Q0H615_SACSY|nr:YbaB/EbfC family nucleoid-associated protein [Saccharothrix syringae]QFZ21300.1 YbaB/EbfC family DNA-binding protein [Saccharothrix syringae]
MADPLSGIGHMIDRWEQEAEQKAARYQEMSREVQQISITASAADGAVTVTVGANGIPSAVTMTDGVRKLAPDRIAAAVMEAMTRAQSRYPERLAEVMAATVGENQTTRYLLDQAREHFPAAEGDGPPRPPRPAGDDDDDFGDASYLQGGR